MTTNGYAGHNGLSGQHGHRQSENLSTLCPEMYRHFSDADFEPRILSQRLHSTPSTSTDANSRLEKLLKDLVSLNVENRVELRRLGTKMEDFVSTVNDKLSRMEENISRGWIDVHDYSGGVPGPEANVRSPVYFRRECSQMMEENEMVNDVEGSEGRPLGVSNVHCAASTQRGSHQEIGDMPDISRDVYPFPSNGITRMNRTTAVHNSTNREGVVMSSVSADRRQSDSTTITALESGYCGEELSENSNGDNVFYDNPPNSSYDINIDRSSSGCQLGVDVTDKKESYDCNDDSRSCSNLVRVDDPDILFVEEVLNAKHSGSQTQSVVVARKDVTESSIGRVRRPSIFTTGLHTSRLGSQLYDSDLDDLINDDDKTVRNQSQHSTHMSMEEDVNIGNINDIFERAADVDTPIINVRNSNTINTPSPSPPIKRKKSSGNVRYNEQKRIRGIAKAPIKREPGTLSVYSNRSGMNTPSLTPPPSTMPASIMTTLQNIEKEKVAHAVDRFERSLDIMDERSGVWRCICGHSNTTKNGMKLHVKNNGTDEARNHIVKDPKDNTVPDKLYGCDKCFNIFVDKNLLRTHLNERNEICKSTPRRRSYPSKSSRRERSVSVPQYDPETSDRPSIVITL